MVLLLNLYSKCLSCPHLSTSTPSLVYLIAFFVAHTNLPCASGF